MDTGICGSNSAHVVLASSESCALLLAGVWPQYFSPLLHPSQVIPAGGRKLQFLAWLSRRHRCLHTREHSVALQPSETTRQRVYQPGAVQMELSCTTHTHKHTQRTRWHVWIMKWVRLVITDCVQSITCFEYIQIWIYYLKWTNEVF